MGRGRKLGSKNLVSKQVVLQEELKAVSEEILEEIPHHSFCVGCKNSDLRILKDNLNTTVLTINRVCEELGIEKHSLALKCKELGKWVEEQKQFKVLNKIKEQKARKKAQSQKE